MNGLEAMLRGLSGGKTGGLGKINYMKPVGGIQGGGVRANPGSAPQVRAPGSSDLMVNPNSALSHGDALLKGYWEELMPTPQQKQARTNADLFAQALVGNEGQQGLLGKNLTPELIAQAAGNMRQGGADAEGLLGFAQWAAPAMAQQQQLAKEQQRMENEALKMQAWLENMRVRTDNARAAGARAAAKGAGGGGKDDPFGSMGGMLGGD